MKRGLKLTAVAAMVVLALTGFSTGRGHGHSRGHSSGSGGGGCSSSSQSHDSSSNSSTSGGSSSSSGSSGSSGSTYDDDDDLYGSDSSGSSGGSSYTRRPGYPSTPTSSASGNGRSTQDGTARLIKCADAKTPYATVEVRNPNSKSVRFDVHVTFVDAYGSTVSALFHEVKVPGKGKVTTKVPVGGDDPDAVVDHCEVNPDASPHR
ncbi:hypothetical protein ACIREE_06725 [Streptomyces sp. NPDC102467]|uniref:hypothetical protein n=1 Tax=Streptomyces sp. NPDC102467 TaxID=3366179 RepID=UPI0038167A5E